jgi:hypothetical protein
VTKDKVLAIAAKFRKMADRIEQNAEEPFGGVFLAIPPGEDSEGVESLILDSKEDLAQFWGMILVKAQKAIADQDSKDRMRTGFGR